MKIFLSFSSVDRAIAEAIHLALLGAGHQVFFDEASLPPGSDYNSRIREAINESGLFRSGRYVQTELKFAKAKWPKPWGSVLPVMIAPTEHTSIDPYLAAVSFLEPRGNVAAEVAAAVAGLISSIQSYTVDKQSLQVPPAHRLGGTRLSSLVGGLVALIVGIISMVASFGAIYLFVLALAATGIVEFQDKAHNAKLIGPLWLLAGLAVVAPVSTLLFKIYESIASAGGEIGGCGPLLLLPWCGVGFAATAVTKYLTPDLLQIRVSGCWSLLLLLVLGVISSLPLFLAHAVYRKFFSWWTNSVLP